MKRITNILTTFALLLGCFTGPLAINGVFLTENSYAASHPLNKDKASYTNGGGSVTVTGNSIKAISCNTVYQDHNNSNHHVIIVTDTKEFDVMYKGMAKSCNTLVPTLKENLKRDGFNVDELSSCKSAVIDSRTGYYCSSGSTTEIGGLPVNDRPSGSTSGSGEDIPTPRPSETLDGNIIDCSDYDRQEGGGVICVLKIVLNVMTFGIGVLAVVGIVIAGIQYITSQGDPGKMAKAKNRIIQVVIGLVIYAVLYAALYFLVPGFNTDMLNP